LLIRGTGRRPATIVVASQPLEIACRKFTLERVKVRASSPRSLAALVTIRSQELAIGGCSFVSKERIDHSAPAHNCAIAWTAVAARDPDAGRIRVTNTVFDAGRAALKFAAAPSRIELDNCLTIGGGLLDLNAASAQREIIVFARHLTLRQSAFLCRLPRPASAGSGGPLRLVLHDSAFDLVGRGAALVQVVASTEPAAIRSIIVTGRESVIRPDVPVIAWSKPGEDAARPVDSRGLVVEGLAVGDFQFVGPPGELAASAIDRQSLAIPRQSDEPPGIIPQRLASEVRSVTLEAN
jgi:hypothetical protein